MKRLGFRCCVLLFFGAFVSLAVANADDQGWIPLFDGKSLNGWKTYAGGGPVADKWVAEDGVLHLTGKGGGHIITEATFDNFELEFEWKISPGGNSGVMYRVRTGDKAPHFSGPEYQVLDDSSHRDGQDEKKSAGSLYALIAAKGKKVNPVGEWNQSRIVLKGNHLEHWLNGVQVVETELHTDEWKALVGDSKFRTWEQFAQTAKGHICLQDHGDPVWYRNIRIRPLK